MNSEIVLPFLSQHVERMTELFVSVTDTVTVPKLGEACVWNLHVKVNDPLAFFLNVCRTFQIFFHR